MTESSPFLGRFLIGAVLLAVAVRLYLFWQYDLISSDGVHYIAAARDFFSSRVRDGLSSVYPPAYPLLVAALYPLTGDWELSGRVISFLGGVLLIIPLYVLFKAVYGERAALLACFLAALSPYLARYSVHVRTESFFLFLSTLALALFHRGVVSVSLSRFFYGGLVAGFAYLVRPEAVGFLAIVPVTLALRSWVKGHHALRSYLGAVAAMFLGFSLFSLPYIVYLSLDSGQGITITRKLGVTLWVGLQESGLLDAQELGQIRDPESLTLFRFAAEYPFLFGKKLGLDLVTSLAAFTEALHYSYMPFLLLGLYSLRKKFWQREDLLLFAFFLFYLVGFALIYPNRRYLVQIVPVSLGWTALGAISCWELLKSRLSPRAFAGAGILLLAAFLGGTLPKTLKPIGREKSNVREAGAYLRQLRGSGRLTLLVYDARVAFYADSPWVNLGDLGEEELLGYLRRGEGDYLVVEAGMWKERYPLIARDPERYGLLPERELEGEKEAILIYRVGKRRDAGKR